MLEKDSICKSYPFYHDSYVNNIHFSNLIMFRYFDPLFFTSLIYRAMHVRASCLQIIALSRCVMVIPVNSSSNVNSAFYLFFITLKY